MEWIELAKEDQLPKDKYFLLINTNAGHNLDVELMINDKWDHNHSDNKECGWCGYEKDTLENCYAGIHCSVNYFHPKIHGRYTHFAIVCDPGSKD